jgi:hypothetical protein
MDDQTPEPWPHTHEFVVVATRPDGTRVYGCIGCDKTKTVLTTEQLESMLDESAA